MNMNRKQFLKTCACSLGSCAAIGALPTTATAAENPPPEDWRLPFIRKRYARLLEALAGKAGDEALSEALQQVGYFCADGYPMVQRHKGNIDGFIRESEQANDKITYDRERGVITVVGAERSECGCPFMQKGLTPGIACDCTVGWNRYAYETLLGRKVRVELKETVLRGGKRCVVEIHVLPSATEAA